MFDQDTMALLVSVIIGMVGIGYCSYGRKHSPYYLVAGIALLLLGFVVSNFWWLLILSVALMAIPYLLDR